jgi:YHS domain-containing protein
MFFSNKKSHHENNFSALAAPVRDPWCNMQIDPRKAAAQETVNGETYYFCSTSCATKFLESK